MKKGFSIKLRILSFTVLPAIVITIALLISGIRLIKGGMEQEILKGLMSSAYTYKDIGMNVTSREAGDSEIESSLKKIQATISPGSMETPERTLLWVPTLSEPKLLTLLSKLL